MSKFNRAPRRTNSEAELKKLIKRYTRMGFTPREARFKALNHHTMKL
jgi:hypothetical protein